ncbi:MAG TPA: diacylglycerol kinase family protein [Patescibacteria group bacterium]
MYYYIIDPPKGSPTAKIAQKLQELITPMGISGEIAIANPARSAEELTYMGIDKGYTTIVAVGGEELANTVATILLNESREKIAMGIIPINAGPLISQMVGVANNDLRAAAEIIKQRHLDLVDMVQISQKRYMLTEAYIVAPRTVKVTLDVDGRVKAELEADYAHLSHDLVLTLQVRQPQGFLKRMMGGAPKPEQYASQFHGKQIRILAHEPLPIMIADQVVAKTPTTFTKIPGALKLITLRAILPQKGMSEIVAKNTHHHTEDPVPFASKK